MKKNIYTRAVSMELKELMDAQLRMYVDTSFDNHHDFMVRHGLNACKSVLDVGSGNGEFTCRIADHHRQTQFTGLDLNNDLFQRAKSHSHEVGTTNVRWIMGDVFDETVIRKLGKYDGIILRYVAQHLKDIEAILASLWSILEDGGTIWIIDTELDNVSSSDESGVFSIYKQGLEMFYKNNHIDGHIGSKLPSLLKRAGFDVDAYEIDPLSNRDMGIDTYQRFLMHGAVLLHAYDPTVYSENDLRLIGKFVEEVVPLDEYYGQYGVVMVAAGK